MNESKGLTLTQAKLAQSVRRGHHATVYEVRRDPELRNKDVIRDLNKPVFPFVSGSQYKGQWSNDMKDGFGIQINPDNTKYEGEWMNNKHHGRGTLWVKKGKVYLRQYVGDWVEGKMEGQGIYYFDNGEIYRGGWVAGKKSGNGRLEYKNGNVYNGEWQDDYQQGLGTMNFANGNVYEGLWANGKKEGPGLFYYASTKKIYQGEWADDQPRCGEYRAPTHNEELRFAHPLPKGIHLNDFKLPELGLENSQAVLDLAISSTRLGNVQKSMSNTNIAIAPVPDSILTLAKERFHQLVRNEKDSKVTTDTVSVDTLGDILYSIRLNISDFELEGIKNQLLDREIAYLSFADIVEIIAFIQSEENVFIDSYQEGKQYK